MTHTAERIGAISCLSLHLCVLITVYIQVILYVEASTFSDSVGVIICFFSLSQVFVITGLFTVI